MKPKMFPLLAFAALCGVMLISNSCGSSPAGCPVCGTQKNGQITLIDVMNVPEHNPNGEPGGPFNIFDISWVDPVNRNYFVSDRIGLDVPVFNTVSNIALWAIGGQNSVAEAGNNSSLCWVDPTSGETIPPITTAQGNFTRFGCKTDGFRLPGFFGPNGNFGGFVGGQCCASRANNLNPLSGPNGMEVTGDGNFLFVGNGSSQLLVFDLAPMITSNYSTAPTLTAVIPTGTSPDYDGPTGITGCMASANGRAFSDPSCGDLRGDEIATTGSVVTFPQDGLPHYLVSIINGDPGLPFVTIVDVTGVVTRTGTPAQQHCLPYSQLTNTAATNPFSPGITPGVVPASTFTANYSTCVLGQIYYDGAAQNDTTVLIDDGGANGANGFVCPDPSLQFVGTPGVPGPPVPSGASGHASGFNPDIPCHHGPQLTATTSTQPGGVFCATGPGTPAGCVGAISPAGLGGMIFYPPTSTFLITNGNSTPDITVGSVDVIDPLHPITVGGVTKYVPAIINSFPVPNCMPTGLNLGPGTDVFVGCADHDGRAFAPSSVIINGTTGAILATLNQVGFVDETWYNPGDNNYYLAARDMPTGPVLGVINAGTRQWLINVPTNGNAHSVAADPINNHIFVPLPSGGANCETLAADGCVGVYAAQ
ncbi:MAG TPA: hypothetical protein VN902_22270 [Candidatus Acidoferrales bacterium]|jgi:hypothetical protein|nr:hypothetical protein [Candidatus Acidoferrales bacterium]